MADLGSRCNRAGEALRVADVVAFGLRRRRRLKLSDPCGRGRSCQGHCDVSGCDAPGLLQAVVFETLVMTGAVSSIRSSGCMLAGPTPLDGMAGSGCNHQWQLIDRSTGSP